MWRVGRVYFRTFLLNLFSFTQSTSQSLPLINLVRVMSGIRQGPVRLFKLHARLFLTDQMSLSKTDTVAQFSHSAENALKSFPRGSELVFCVYMLSSWQMFIVGWQMACGEDIYFLWTLVWLTPSTRFNDQHAVHSMWRSACNTECKYACKYACKYSWDMHTESWMSYSCTVGIRLITSGLHHWY